jgi:hypothetical protein
MEYANVPGALGSTSGTFADEIGILGCTGIEELERAQVQASGWLER